MRAALYWAPAPDDLLWSLGCAWLGRDPATGAARAQPALDNIAELTEQPRHYGFHATLRPPMRLAGTLDDFRAAARACAAALAPFTLPPLHIAGLDGFLALTVQTPCPDLRRLADTCIEHTNPLRAPAPPDELARRRAAGLTPRQEENLQRWGYPYVMEDFTFHLTLTRRLTQAEIPAVRHAATCHFAPVIAAARRVTGIAIFAAEHGLPFRLIERIAFPKK